MFAINYETVGESPSRQTLRQSQALNELNENVFVVISERMY